jgi:hypothetical protein
MSALEASDFPTFPTHMTIAGGARIALTSLPADFNYVDGPFTASTAHPRAPSIGRKLSDEEEEVRRIHLARWDEGARCYFARQDAARRERERRLSALIDQPRRVTELPDVLTFRSLSRAEQHGALSSASMDALHALLGRSLLPQRSRHAVCCRHLRARQQRAAQSCPC